MLFINKVSLVSEKLRNDSVSFTIANFFYKCFLPISFVGLIFGLRYDVGVDYLAYKGIYEDSITNNLLYNISELSLEPLFVVVSTFLKTQNIEYWGFFTVMAMIPLCFYYSFFKKTRRELFSLTTYFAFCFGVFFWYFNIMRQGIAFFILLYSFQYILEKKVFKFLFFVIIATGFHYSSIIFLPFYFASDIGRFFLYKNRWLCLLTYLITWLFADFFVSILLYLSSFFISGKYAYYASRIGVVNMEGGTGLGLLTYHIIDLLIINITFSFINKIPSLRTLFVIYFTGVIILNIAQIDMVLSRVPFSLVSFRCLICAVIIKNVLNNWNATSFLLRVQTATIFILSFLLLMAGISSFDYKFIPEL